jgi:NADH dehydrogenase
LIVLLNWAWQYLSWQSGARLITGSDQLPGWQSQQESHPEEAGKRAAG